MKKIRSMQTTYSSGVIPTFCVETDLRVLRRNVVSCSLSDPLLLVKREFAVAGFKSARCSCERDVFRTGHAGLIDHLHQQPGIGFPM